MQATARVPLPTAIVTAEIHRKTWDTARSSGFVQRPFSYAHPLTEESHQRDFPSCKNTKANQLNNTNKFHKITINNHKLRSIVSKWSISHIKKQDCAQKNSSNPASFLARMDFLYAERPSTTAKPPALDNLPHFPPLSLEKDSIFVHNRRERSIKEAVFSLSALRIQHTRYISAEFPRTVCSREACINRNETQQRSNNYEIIHPCRC